MSSELEPPELRRILREADPETAARAVLGGRLVHGPVELEIVEVEAYGGPLESPFPDPAAHTWSGPTPRNRVMFGDAGHLYCYLSHGIHTCVNVTCGPVGQGGGVLLRAARVLAGNEEVSLRRPRVPVQRWARGPGNLGRASGARLSDRGMDLLDPRSALRFSSPAGGVLRGGSDVASGPRVGVSAAADVPWRFWIAGAPEVSAYRRSPRAPALGAVEAADGGQ